MDINPSAQIVMKDGKIVLTSDVKVGVEVIGTGVIQIELHKLLEVVTKATPTELDDKALPFIKMILSMLENKAAPQV